MDLKDKITRFQALVQVSPADELARFSLGQALYDASQYEAAAEHLAKALELEPNWMMAAILLGKCRLELGQRKEAKEAFLRALDLAREQRHDGPVEELQALLSEL